MKKLSSYILVGLATILVVFSSNGQKFLSECFQECRIAVAESNCCSSEDEDDKGCCDDSGDCCEIQQDHQVWNVYDLGSIDGKVGQFLNDCEIPVLQTNLAYQVFQSFPARTEPPPSSDLHIKNCIWLI